MEIAALIVSGVALVVSALAWWQAKRQADAATRGTALSEVQHARELEAAREADLTARIVVTPPQPPRNGSIREAIFAQHEVARLVVTNRGRGIARGVDAVAEVAFGTAGEEPTWSPSPFPCDVPPGTEVARSFPVHAEVARRIQVSVTWTDSRVDKQEFRATLAV